MLIEHKHLDFDSRWQQLIERHGASPIPYKMNSWVLKSLSQCFTHRNNSYGNAYPNIAFQRDLDELLEADGEYREVPSLPRLWILVAELIHRWESGGGWCKAVIWFPGSRPLFALPLISPAPPTAHLAPASHFPPLPPPLTTDICLLLR